MYRRCLNRLLLVLSGFSTVGPLPRVTFFGGDSRRFSLEQNARKQPPAHESYANTSSWWLFAASPGRLAGLLCRAVAKRRSVREVPSNSGYQLTFAVSRDVEPSNPFPESPFFIVPISMANDSKPQQAMVAAIGRAVPS